jgi:RHS repeat-associated protein
VRLRLLYSSHDAEGRIVTLENSTGGSTLGTYVYDALGHRIQTVVGSANTEFVFNPAGQRVSTWNGATGAQIQGQYYWGAKPVAFYKGGQTYFQHQDWEGTERLRTTYNGSTEGAFASLPFGDALTTTSGSDNDAYHYGMLDHDYESDTEHAQFRQYSSAQGHWLSPDPYQGSYDFSNPQSLNRYVYALNNPLSMIDPSGLDANCNNSPTTDPSAPTIENDGGDTSANTGETCAATGGGAASDTIYAINATAWSAEAYWEWFDSIASFFGGGYAESFSSAGGGSAQSAPNKNVFGAQNRFNRAPA